MKKTVIVLLAALSFAVASAQSVDTTAVSDSGRAPTPTYNYTSAVVRVKPTFNSPSIVRNINLSYSLAVGQSGNDVYFYVIDHDDFNTTSYSPPGTPNITANYMLISSPSNKITVEDMYIVDNYAFFCGYVVEPFGQYAIYGYFNFSSLLLPSPTLPVTVYIKKLTASTPTTAPIKLSDLVAYKIGSVYHLVAIGDENLDHYYCNTKIVEIINVTGTPTINVATIQSNPGPYYAGKVFLDDVVLTDNNVVVVGRDWNITSPSGISYPCFLIGNKGYVVSNICASLNNYYVPIAWDANDTVAGVALNANRFAMAYVYYNSANYKYYTRLRIFTSMGTITNTNSQQFLKTDKENPVEMIYMQNPHRIELLQPIANPSNFIKLLPYSTSSYTTAMLKPDGNVYESLSRIGPLNSGTAFISARESGFYLEDRPSTLPHSNSSCPANANLSVSLISNTTVSLAVYSILSGTNNKLDVSIYKTLYNAAVTGQCFSYK